MNLETVQQAIKNIYKSPVTTIAGGLLAAALTVTNKPDAKQLAIAFLVALLGAISKIK
jgi:hypothetical protein